MSVIDANGVLAHNGASDDRPTPDTADVPGAGRASLAVCAQMAGLRAVSLLQVREAVRLHCAGVRLWRLRLSRAASRMRLVESN